jgi:uncharacterized protein (DUF952 family)
MALPTSLDPAAVYKILEEQAWKGAPSLGCVPWAAIDRQDGFVHLSAAHQVAETAARHFAGRAGLVLLEIVPGPLTDLRWEPSRGGQDFPHVYGDIPLTAVRAVADLPWSDGFDFDALVWSPYAAGG